MELDRKTIEHDEEYLKNNLSNCNIQVINGADHSYTGRYEELGKVIKNNMEWLRWILMLIE